MAVEFKHTTIGNQIILDGGSLNRTSILTLNEMEAINLYLYLHEYVALNYSSMIKDSPFEPLITHFDRKLDELKKLLGA